MNIGVGVNVSSTINDSKMKSSSEKRCGKKKKIFACELSFSVDCATSATEEVAVKINTMMASNDNAGTASVEECLAIGWLQRHTPLYFFAREFLAQKRYRVMLNIMKDEYEKFE